MCLSSYYIASDHHFHPITNVSLKTNNISCTCPTKKIMHQSTQHLNINNQRSKLKIKQFSNHKRNVSLLFDICIRTERFLPRNFTPTVTSPVQFRVRRSATASPCPCTSPGRFSTPDSLFSRPCSVSDSSEPARGSPPSSAPSGRPC